VASQNRASLRRRWHPVAGAGGIAAAATAVAGLHMVHSGSVAVALAAWLLAGAAAGFATSGST
jgi:hypothetical protein